MNILVVRLGAMGDVIHALPAAASLRSIPQARITWLIEPRWKALIEGNPDVDEIVTLDRRRWSSVARCWRSLRSRRFDIAVDLQGLIKSAVAARVSGAERIVGFDRSETREKPASLFYSQAVLTKPAHVVDKGIELAIAAGAREIRQSFWLPPGQSEGAQLERPFVLACPLAGWRAKQWPVEYYSALAEKLRSAGVRLVVNGPPESAARLREVRGADIHLSGIAGLIDATRQAAAVVGVDSGPLHLAAALGKPGVAIFGPTDPARNGPYGGTVTVLRDAGAVTTYARSDEISESMRSIGPDMVAGALLPRLKAEVSR